VLYVPSTIKLYTMLGEMSMDAGKAKSIKIGKDKRAKDGDGKQLADGESCIAAKHWGKIVAKCGGEVKLLKALGVTDKRQKKAKA